MTPERLDQIRERSRYANGGFAGLSEEDAGEIIAAVENLTGLLAATNANAVTWKRDCEKAGFRLDDVRKWLTEWRDRIPATAIYRLQEILTGP